MNVNDAIQCLEWIKHQNYELHIDEKEEFSKNACKLISKCNKNLSQIKHIHSLLEDVNDIFIQTALINAYGQCSKDWTNSLAMFDSIADSNKNKVCIGAIMKVLLDYNEGNKVLDIYDKFNKLSLIDDISNALSIKACVLSNNYEKGTKIHQNLYKRPDFLQNIKLKNVLIDFYAYFGDLTTAKQIFCADASVENDAISVCALMKGYFYRNEYEQALQIYDENMSINDNICHIMAIKACIKTNNFLRGQQIEKSLSANPGTVVKTSLIDFYAHFGDVQKAENHLSSIGLKNMDIVAVNSMMTGYIGNNEIDKALLIYSECAPHISHNETSHILAIKACALKNDYQNGVDIHSKFDVITRDMKNVLIDFYGQFNDIVNAKQMFDSVADKDKDIVTINAMMKAYNNANMSAQCIQLFNDLSQINDDLTCDAITFSSVLKACTQSTGYRDGESIRNILNDEQNKHLLDTTMVQTNLIHMYGKSGMLNECKQIFDESKCRDIGIWNAMINAFGRNRDLQNVEDLYDKMKANDVCLDSKTYKILITTYSHCGEVDKASNIWLSEINDDSLRYDPFVISSLIDCYSRKGMLFEAYQLLLEYEEFTQNPDIDDIHKEVMWTSLLSGCKKHNDEAMAAKIDEEMKGRVNMKDFVDGNDDTTVDSWHEKSKAETMGTASVLMSNIFGAGADFDKVNEIRAEMKRRGWKKKPGFSECDIYSTMHRFYAGWGYRKTPEYRIIDDKLEYMSSKMEEYGYKRDYSAITRQLKDWETPDAVLNRHGEKLAVTYALLTTQPDYYIVVNKNIRICVDCHNWMKMVSHLEKRKLIIADNNRVHTFENGKCTCNDYW